MKITLVRHAESIYNEKGLFQGQADCPLSARGIKKTKEKKLLIDFDICFCSPLLRTKQTAEILVPFSKIIYDDRLKEIGLGDWENTSITKEKRSLLKNKVIPSNGETFESFDNRILNFLNMLKKDYNSQNILIITHAGVICAIHRILRLSIKSIDNLETITINF